MSPWCRQWFVTRVTHCTIRTLPDRLPDDQILWYLFMITWFFFGSVTFWSQLFLNSGATFFAYEMRRKTGSTMIHGPWKFSVFNQNDQCNLYDWAVGSPEWWFTGCPIGSNNDRINSAFAIFWFWQKINQKNELTMRFWSNSDEVSDFG